MLTQKRRDWCRALTHTSWTSSAQVSRRFSPSALTRGRPLRWRRRDGERIDGATRTVQYADVCTIALQAASALQPFSHTLKPLSSVDHARPFSANLPAARRV